MTAEKRRKVLSRLCREDTELVEVVSGDMPSKAVCVLQGTTGVQGSIQFEEDASGETLAAGSHFRSPSSSFGQLYALWLQD